MVSATDFPRGSRFRCRIGREKDILNVALRSVREKPWVDPLGLAGCAFTPKFWKTSTTFKGNKVFQRNDLFDPQATSSWKVRGKTVTGTNIERMATGRAPIGTDGKAVNLHHLTQTQNGGIAEVSGSMHQKYYSTLHINTGQLPSGIDRSAFNSWRESYWMNRSTGF